MRASDAFLIVLVECIRLAGIVLLVMSECKSKGDFMQVARFEDHEASAGGCTMAIVK